MKLFFYECEGRSEDGGQRHDGELQSAEDEEEEQDALSAIRLPTKQRHLSSLFFGSVLFAETK